MKNASERLAAAPKMRGIQVIQRKLKSGEKVTQYRVQIKRKSDGVREDKLYDDFNEAREFLLANMSKTGRSRIDLLEELKKESAAKFVADFFHNTFEMFSEAYITDYIKPQYRSYDKTTAYGKAKLRGLSNTKSFFKTINATLVQEIKEEDLDESLNPLWFGRNPPQKFGSLKPNQITSHVLNEYIKVRLKSVQPVTVEREVQHISNLFKKLKYIDPRLKHIQFPDFDKGLLSSKRTPKNRNKFLIKNSDLEAIRAAIENYSNPELGWIISLMLHTAARRGEICLLTWEDVDEDRGEIRFFHTKNGQDRFIHMSDEVRKIIENIRKFNPHYSDNRLFSYTVLGFDGSYTKLIENLFEKKLISEKITSHRFRKESISRMVIKAKGNYLLLAEILGISNVDNLKKKFDAVNIQNPETDDEILKHIGHTSANITKRHYFSLR